jgi:hypothetical protein
MFEPELYTLLVTLILICRSERRNNDLRNDSMFVTIICLKSQILKYLSFETNYGYKYASFLLIHSAK